MARYETALFVLLIPVYLVALGLYHYMVFAVNRQRPVGGKIPHSLFLGQWHLVRDEYKSLNPRGFAYEFTLICAVTVLVFAIAFAVLRVWEYTSGRLP